MKEFYIMLEYDRSKNKRLAEQLDKVNRKFVLKETDDKIIIHEKIFDYLQLMIEESNVDYLSLIVYDSSTKGIKILVKDAEPFDEDYDSILRILRFTREAS